MAGNAGKRAPGQAERVGFLDGVGSPRELALLDRILRPFAPVHRGEGLVALLLFLCVFALLCAYYVLKTAREGLILSGGMFGLAGAELKIYATGAMALVLVAVIPAYGALANRVGRMRLIDVSYGIVLACLLAFYALAQAGVSIGLVFYIWLGLVNMFLVAQFWSYANDVYTEEQGKRLFGLVAVGASAGAIIGPKLTGLADSYTLLVIAAAMLAGVLALFHAIERIHAARSVSPIAEREVPITGAGGFELVLRDRYLLLIAAMVLVATLVNTIGEFVLSSVATDRAAELVPATAFPELTGAAREAAITAARRDYLTAFYGDFFFWVNLVGFVVQAFLVSRLIDKLGVRAALFVLPVIAFGAYGLIGLVGGVVLLRVAKIAENAANYSVQNTVRQALFLPTTRAVKYKAKAAIDTFFVRFGDTISAILVGVGLHQLELGPRDLAFANVGLVAVWLAIAVAIARRHRALETSGGAR